jgi:hypothetical protein
MDNKMPAKGRPHQGPKLLPSMLAALAKPGLTSKSANKLRRATLGKTFICDHPIEKARKKRSLL